DITGPVNVGAGKTTPVNKLAEILIELTGNQANGIRTKNKFFIILSRIFWLYDESLPILFRS
ncbi:hypothetical protein HY02_07110, partial [Peptococcaceae bacterium SCADC1_2_3]